MIEEAYFGQNICDRTDMSDVTDMTDMTDRIDRTDMTEELPNIARIQLLIVFYNCVRDVPIVRQVNCPFSLSLIHI